MTSSCIFCERSDGEVGEVILENEHCLYLQMEQPVLKG